MEQRTPPDAVRTRKGRGGKQFRYVTRTLNQAFGWAWDFEVLDTRIVPEDNPQEVFVRRRLRPTPERRLSRIRSYGL